MQYSNKDIQSYVSSFQWKPKQEEQDHEIKRSINVLKTQETNQENKKQIKNRPNKGTIKLLSDMFSANNNLIINLFKYASSTEVYTKMIDIYTLNLNILRQAKNECS